LDLKRLAKDEQQLAERRFAQQLQEAHDDHLRAVEEVRAQMAALQQQYVGLQTAVSFVQAFDQEWSSPKVFDEIASIQFVDSLVFR
jgi:hypothetical protein